MENVSREVNIESTCFSSSAFTLCPVVIKVNNSNEGVKSSRPLLGKNAFNILQQMDQSGPVVVPYALIIFLNY